MRSAITAKVSYVPTYFAVQYGLGGILPNTSQTATRKEAASLDCFEATKAYDSSTNTVLFQAPMAVMIVLVLLLSQSIRTLQHNLHDD